MIKIQNQCTPDQARQLHDAIKAAGLEYPAIDWAFYLITTGHFSGDIETSKEITKHIKAVDALNKQNEENGWAKIDYSGFIPCPTLAELMAMLTVKVSVQINPEHGFDQWFNALIGNIKYGPEICKVHWAKLQEESQ